MLNLFYNDNIQADLSKIDHSAAAGEGSTEGAAFKMNLKAAQAGVAEQENQSANVEVDAGEADTNYLNVSESDFNSDTLLSTREQSFDASTIDTSVIDASTLDSLAPHSQFSFLAESKGDDVDSKVLLHSAMLYGESEINQSELKLISEPLTSNSGELPTLSEQIRLPTEPSVSEGSEIPIPFTNSNSANQSIIDKVFSPEQTGRRALARITGNNLPPLQHSATGSIEAIEQSQGDSGIDIDNVSSNRFISSPELTTKHRLFSSFSADDNSIMNPITSSVNSNQATPIKSMGTLEIGEDGEVKMNNDFMGQKGMLEQSSNNWFSLEKIRNSNKMTSTTEALSSATFEDPTLISTTSTPTRANSATSSLNPQVHNEATSTQVYSRHQAGTEQWRNEISTQVNWLKGRNINSAEVHLHPAELGSIEIKISTDDDRTVVSIITANHLTKEVIEESLPKLKDLFNANGLMLDETNVSHHQKEETDASQNSDSLFNNSENDDKEQEHNGESDDPSINSRRMDASTTYIDHYA